MYPQCIFLHHPDYSDGSFYKRNWQLSSWNLATWIYRSVWCDLYIFIWDSLTSRQWRAVGCNSWSGDTLQCFWIYRSASCSRIHISGTYQHAFRPCTRLLYIFLHEKLSLQGAIGAFLIMVGVVIAASTHEEWLRPLFPEICFIFLFKNASAFGLMRKKWDYN